MTEKAKNVPEQNEAAFSFLEESEESRLNFPPESFEGGLTARQEYIRELREKYQDNPLAQAQIDNYDSDSDYHQKTFGKIKEKILTVFELISEANLEKNPDQEPEYGQALAACQEIFDLVQQAKQDIEKLQLDNQSWQEMIKIKGLEAYINCRSAAEIYAIFFKKTPTKTTT